MFGIPPLPVPDNDKKQTVLLMTAVLRNQTGNTEDAFTLAATLYEKYDELQKSHDAKKPE